MSLRPIHLLLLCALAVVTSCRCPESTEATVCDWPQWLGPARNGISPQTGLFHKWPPKKLWTAQVGWGPSSPVVSNGRVYVMGHAKQTKSRGTDTVYCLDAKTGTVIWKHAYPALTCKTQDVYVAGPRATPAVDGNAVYTFSVDGQLFCLDATTGNVIWSKDVTRDLGGRIPGFYGYCCSPLIYGKVLIMEINAPNSSYVALDKASGEVIWRSGTDGATCGSPVVTQIDGSPCAVFVSSNSVVGVNVADGRGMWRQGMDWIMWMGPLAVAGNQVFVSSASLNRGCALVRVERGQPRIIWQDKTKHQCLHCNTVLYDGYLYGFDNTGTDYDRADSRKSSLKCIKFDTGEVRWVKPGMGWGNLILADGKLIILRETGELVVADAAPDAYRERHRADVIPGPCWTVPALSAGRLYCRNNTGELVCLLVAAR